MVEIIIQTQKKQIQVFTEKLSDDVDLELVQIPSGSFIMGTPTSEKNSRDNERPQHEVKINSFFMGRYPITQAQWKVIADREDLQVNKTLENDPSHFKSPYERNDSPIKDRWQRPVESISWDDAVEFCDRLSKLTKKKYQLPSESQWEYACRAVTSYQSSVISEELGIEEWNQKYHQPFHFGETITTDLANYDGNYTYGDGQKGVYRKETTPVGIFPPNSFGLCDMHGNVWEWCADNWHDNYTNAPRDGSAWIDEKNHKCVMRGGSCDVTPYCCRSGIRDFNNTRDSYVIGLRVILCNERTF